MELSTELDALIDSTPPERFGMRDGAAWDALLMLDLEDWDFTVWMSWHFNCFFGKSDTPFTPPRELGDEP